MPVQRDVPTVDASGRRLDSLPDGVLLRDLVTHTDERGTVCELIDARWNVTRDDIVFAYLFTIRPGMAKGWGMHREHEDRYAFLAGELEIALYDGREDGPTAGTASRLFLSGLHRQMLVIPRGVWHAERNVGLVDVQVVNFPTIAYDHAHPDKYRLALDTDELPGLRLGPEWRGS
jgi:dTDP-4-dehydrorhamnose 3,5-epimerase